MYKLRGEKQPPTVTSYLKETATMINMTDNERN